MLWGMLPRTVFAVLPWRIGTHLIREILGFSLKPKMQLPMDRIMWRFFPSVTRAAPHALLVLVAIAVFGIPMVSVMVVVVSTGVILRLTIQGILSSLTGDIILTPTRPFATGNCIEAAQVGDTIDEVGLFYVVLVGTDNEKIAVSNGSLMSTNITNYSSMARRHLSLTSLVGRNEDPKRVKGILRVAVTAESAASRPPDAVTAPLATLTEL